MNSLVNIFCFLVALLSAVKVDVIGELTLGEILLIASLPFLYKRIWAIIDLPYLRVILLLLIVYLLSQIAVDLYRLTPKQDFLRGWAKIVIFGFALLGLGALLFNSKKRVIFYILGFCLAPILSIMLYGLKFPIYKFYIGIPISVLALLSVLIIPRSAKALALILPLFAGIAAFLLNSRSLAGMTLVAAVYGGLLIYNKSQPQRSKINTLVVMAIMGACAFAVFQFYIIGAPKGWFGEDAITKYENQSAKSTSGDFSVLSGRQELLFSWPKIAESPVVGWGSWAKDSNFYIGRAKELGLRVSRTAVKKELIPTHSHLFGAWVECGIAGAIFWAACIGLAASVLIRSQLSKFGDLSPALGFIAILFFWDILFSPFAGERRVHDAFVLWILIISSSSRKSLELIKIRRGDAKRLSATKYSNSVAERRSLQSP